MDNRPLPRRVLITGASSGLGRALAIQLGRRGWRIAITGRREGKLDHVANETRAAGAESVLALVGSVADHATVAQHYARIREVWGGLDWAILNAGVADSCAADNFTSTNFRWTFETNVFGACEWIEAVLPDMLAAAAQRSEAPNVGSARGSRSQSHAETETPGMRANPVIAGVSSPAGWRGFPRMGSYSASKAALSTLLESLRVELRGRGVDIITICPGWVKSEITLRNEPGSMWMLLEADDGAARLIRGIEKRKRIVHFPFPVTHFLRYLIRPLPGLIFDPVVSRLVRPKKTPYIDESEAEKARRDAESKRQMVEKLKEEGRR